MKVLIIFTLLIYALAQNPGVGFFPSAFANDLDLPEILEYYVKLIDGEVVFF